MSFVELFAQQLGADPNSLDPIALARELTDLRTLQERHHKREGALTARLALKEEQIQELHSHLAELRECLQPRMIQTRVTLLDPGVVEEYRRLRTEAKDAQAKLKQTQEDLDAAKYHPDSVLGRKLVSKLRLLTQENQEFAQMMAESEAQKLKNLAAVEKAKVKEFRKAIHELNELLGQYEDDAETMQQTIRSLQWQMNSHNNNNNNNNNNNENNEEDNEEDIHHRHHHMEEGMSMEAHEGEGEGMDEGEQSGRRREEEEDEARAQREGEGEGGDVSLFDSENQQSSSFVGENEQTAVELSSSSTSLPPNENDDQEKKKNEGEEEGKQDDSVAGKKREREEEVQVEGGEKESKTEE